MASKYNPNIGEQAVYVFPIKDHMLKSGETFKDMVRRGEHFHPLLQRRWPSDAACLVGFRWDKGLRAIFPVKRFAIEMRPFREETEKEEIVPFIIRHFDVRSLLYCSDFFEEGAVNAKMNSSHEMPNGTGFDQRTPCHIFALDTLVSGGCKNLVEARKETWRRWKK